MFYPYLVQKVGAMAGQSGTVIHYSRDVPVCGQNQVRLY